MTKITSKDFDLFHFYDCEWKAMEMVGQAKTHTSGTTREGKRRGACRRRNKRRGRDRN